MTSYEPRHFPKPQSTILRAIMFFILFTLVLVGHGCGESPSESLIGKWKEVDGEERVEFFADGSARIQGTSIASLEGAWKILEDGRLQMDFSDIAPGVIILSRIELTEEGLTITNEGDGEKTYYARDSSSDTVSVDKPDDRLDQIIKAIQTEDFEIIFKYGFAYQLRLIGQQKSRPKAVWDKMAQEFEAKMKDELYGEQPSGLAVFRQQGSGESIYHPTKACSQYIVPPHEYELTETRDRQVNVPTGGLMTGDPITVVSHYVVVSYTDQDTSPLKQQKRLKQTILEFQFEKITNYLVDIKHISDGDEFWPEK